MRRGHVPRAGGAVSSITLAECGIRYPGSDVLWDVEVAPLLERMPPDEPWLIHDGTLHGVPAPGLVVGRCASMYAKLPGAPPLSVNPPNERHEFPSNFHCGCGCATLDGSERLPIECMVFVRGRWTMRLAHLFPGLEI